MKVICFSFLMAYVLMFLLPGIDSDRATCEKVRKVEKLWATFPGAWASCKLRFP